MGARLVGADIVAKRFKMFADIDKAVDRAAPRFEKIVWRGNERGMLAGEDKDGNRLADLAPGTILRRKPGELLTPMVPKGKRSRVIKNFVVTHFRQPDGKLVILAAYRGVLSKKGVPFLRFHLEGRGNNPLRPFAGVRPKERSEITAEFRDILRKLKKG